MNNKVVTFGEIMLRLTPSGNDLLVQAKSFDAHFGGSEYNVAAGLVSLGLSATFVTRLPDNPIGHSAHSAIRKTGVDTFKDIFTPDGRLGIYYLEVGSSPRPSRVVYDRGGSSIAVADAASYNWSEYLSDAGWFHVSGITPALGPSAFKATNDAIDMASDMKIPISFDINFRKKLWSETDARNLLGPILGKCKVVISTEEDLDRVFGITGDNPKELSEKAREMFGVEIVAITLRELITVRRNKWGGCTIGNDGYFESKTYDVEIIDRVGAGDSFTAGLIAGLIEKDLKYAIELASAFSALKQTIPGDVCLASREQTEELMSSGSPGRIQR